MDTEVIRVCKLEDGREMEYDACNLINADPIMWEYLGVGKVIWINGVKQNLKKIERFYKKRF